MRLDSSLGQGELERNSLIAEPQHQLPEYTLLPRCQRLLSHIFSDTASHLGSERDATLKYRVNSVDQVIRSAAQQKVATRTALKCAADPGLAVAVRQNHEPTPRFTTAFA